mgnify:CR=1 FL=1
MSSETTSRYNKALKAAFKSPYRRWAQNRLVFGPSVIDLMLGKLVPWREAEKDAEAARVYQEAIREAEAAPRPVEGVLRGFDCALQRVAEPLAAPDPAAPAAAPPRLLIAADDGNQCLAVDLLIDERAPPPTQLTLPNACRFLRNTTSSCSQSRIT